MWDDDGITFLSREAFEARVDDLIAQGLISSTDRAAFMERYDWCVTHLEPLNIFAVVLFAMRYPLL